MHAFGVISPTANGVNHIYGVLINSLFNTGVSIFMLISGYYGIRFSIRKFIALELEVLFYSIIGFAIQGWIRDDWSIRELVQAIVPVMSSKYWYITTYMLMLLFSKYINMVSEKLDRKNYEELIILMLVVFCVFPTIIRFHVMNDGGKGPLNMLLMYFVGRYIRLYWDDKKNITLIVKIAVITLITGFFLNMVVGGNVFARDCSIIIVVGSTAIFMAFKQWKFYAKWINALAKHVLAIYLFEGVVREVIGRYYDITVWENDWCLFAKLALYVVLIMVVCIVIDVLRRLLMKHFEHIILLFVTDKIEKIKVWNSELLGK